MDVVRNNNIGGCFRSSCGSEDKCGDGDSETEQYPEFSSCHQAETMYKSLQDELKQATEKEEPASGDGDHQFHLELDQVIPDDAISLSPSIESLEVDESR